jgi:hypothetical protein
MPKRTLKPRIFTVGTMVAGLALVSAWKIFTHWHRSCAQVQESTG